MARSFLTALIISLLLLPLSMTAQQKPSARERESWMKEMQQYKTDFIVKKLELTDEQKAKFLPVYNRMDQEVRQLNDQTMKLERDVRKKGDKATNLEREKAAEAQFELKGKEGAIEMKYFKDFKTILSTDQLLKLKKAERDFSRQLMNKHREHKTTKK